MKKTNKLISILLVLAMLLSMAPMTVFAATVVASGNFGASGSNLTWSLDSDGVLTISGSGEMEDFANAASVPWYRQRSNIKTVVIESGVTNIGKDAFYGISSLVNATISDTVTSIGNRAFSNSALTNFEFSDAGNLKSIGNSAFNSTRIKSMVIPDGVTTLGSYVFGYGPIKSVTIPASVTSVGNYFFEEATDLNEVIFLGNKEPENIGNTVFLGCSSLAYVSVPADYEGDTFSNMKVAKAAASVAEVNGQGFTTLADAVSAAQSINGAELKLLSHISIDSGITIESGNFTIDLNGKELFSNGYYVLRVDGADVTIVDSAGGGIFNATNDQGNIVLEVLSGSANISGGTFNSVSYPVTVKGGLLKITSKDFIFSNGNKRIGWYGGSIDLSACTADEVRIQPNADELQASAVTLPDGWGLFKTNGTPCTDFVKYDIYVAKAGCKVTASVNPAEGGTVEGAGTYSSGATVTLTASAANGYRFVNWTENGEEVSTSEVYTFTVSENRELTANFEIVPHTHSFTYFASGDTITAVCENTDGNCPDSEGTLTISAPADLYVDGTTAKEAVIDNQLADTSVTYEVTYSTADGSAPKTAGTYAASVTVGGATASVQFELVKRSAIAENFVYTAPENLVYDGTAKYATVEVSPEITGMGEITVTYYKDGEAVEPINAGTYTVKVSTADSDKYYAINDVELASFTIQTKDISDGFIILGDPLTYNGTEQTQTVEKVLATGTAPEATYTVSGNKATNVGVYLLTVTGTGNFTGEAKIAYEIAVDASGVEGLTIDNVKSSDKENVEYVYNQLDNAVTDLADDAKKAEWDNLKSDCVELLKMIESVADKLEGFKNKLAGYDIDTVKSDDADDLESFYNDEVAQVYNDYFDNLTEAETKEFDNILSGISALQKRISDVANEITRITDAVNGYDKATVKSIDKADIEQLLADINALTTGNNITDSERADLLALADTVNELLAVINDTADEINRIVSEVNAYDINTVTGDDVQDLLGLIDDANALLETDNLTSEETDALNQAVKDVQSLISRYDRTSAQLADIKERMNSYDEATVKSSDKADIEQLIADIKDLTDGQNITAEEREYLVNADAECDKLLAKIAETKSEYDRVIAAANGYDEATVTSADKDALVKLNDDIYALALTDNVTAEEKSNLQAAHDKVLGLIDKLTGISDEIKRIIEAVDKYVFESVKSSDKADIQQLIVDIKALLDTQNITADERTLLETADETCDKLVAKIDETVAEMGRINDATNAYDIDTVTSADKADIEKLLADIKALTEGDNITDTEREQLNGNDEALDALLERINATADEIVRIEKAVNSYDEATVKSTDKSDLEKLVEDIKALTDATNITEEERAELGELDATVDSLIKKIDDTAAEIARIDEAVNGYDEETVKSSDIPVLGKLIEDIKALTDGDNITEEEKAALETTDKAIDELVEKLEEVAEEIKRVDEATKSYDIDYVKSPDSEDLAQLKEDIQALVDSDNTTENEKTALGEMIEKVNTLEDKIEEIENQLEEIAELENGYDPETVTSDDKAAIEDAIAEIEAVNSDNLTDEQKAEYAEIKAELETLLEEIAAAEKAVEDIGIELEMFDENRVTIFWEDEIEALKAKIDELLADENMGEAEKAKLNEYKAQAEKLIEIINDPCEYFSMRLFYFVWDALNWLVNHVIFIFNWIVAMF